MGRGRFLTEFSDPLLNSSIAGSPRPPDDLPPHYRISQCARGCATTLPHPQPILLTPRPVATDRHVLCSLSASPAVMTARLPPPGTARSNTEQSSDAGAKTGPAEGAGGKHTGRGMGRHQGSAGEGQRGWGGVMVMWRAHRMHWHDRVGAVPRRLIAASQREGPARPPPHTP